MRALLILLVIPRYLALQAVFLRRLEQLVGLLLLPQSRVRELYQAKGGAKTCTPSNKVFTTTPVRLTKAKPAITVGQKASDTAIVSGTIPTGATLQFELYQAKGGAKTCTPSNKVFTTTPVGLVKAGQYESQATVLNQAGTYYWVETVPDHSGATVHRGQCGLEDETTTVTASGAGGAALAQTGMSGPLPGLAALGLTGLGAGLTLTRRRLTH